MTTQSTQEPTHSEIMKELKKAELRDITNYYMTIMAVGATFVVAGLPNLGTGIAFKNYAME